MTEDEMVGWHHRLDGHEFDQVQEMVEGQGSLACCSPQSHKELDMTEQLNKNNRNTGVGIHSHRQRGLLGYNSWGHKDLDTTEATDISQFSPKYQIWVFKKRCICALYLLFKVILLYSTVNYIFVIIFII